MTKHIPGQRPVAGCRAAFDKRCAGAVFHVPENSTKEQNRISDEIVAADSGESIVKEAKSFHEPIDEVADQIGDEIEGEYPEFLSEVQDRAEEFVNRAKEDPAATLKEVGKGILMVAGAMAILKGLFRRH